jgi:hypothetical protein
MTNLYVTEYEGFVNVNGNPLLALPGAYVAKQVVANAGATTQSAAFNARTKFVRLHTDSICSVNVGGANPVATVTDPRLAANQTEYVAVVPGEKLAVILNT